MRVPAMVLTLPLSLFWACAADPAVTEDVAVAVGVATPVEVLDAAFVRFEGERRPLEYFLWQVRQRCRAAAGDVDALPAVRLVIRPEAAGVGPAWLDGVSTELRKAGVRHITFGDRS